MQENRGIFRINSPFKDIVSADLHLWKSTIWKNFGNQKTVFCKSRSIKKKLEPQICADMVGKALQNIIAKIDQPDMKTSRLFRTEKFAILRCKSAVMIMAIRCTLLSGTHFSAVYSRAAFYRRNFLRMSPITLVIS